MSQPAIATWAVSAGIFVDDDKGHTVCAPQGNTLLERKYRANLIAAAPELLSALKKAYNAMAANNDPFDADVWEEAVNAVFAAIQKAEGRQ